MKFNLSLTDGEVAMLQMLMKAGAEALLMNIAGQCQAQASAAQAASAHPEEPISPQPS